MRKLLSLTLILLSLAVPALAQVNILTIKNIRFLTLDARNVNHRVIIKTVQVDEFSADIYTSDDIIHIKVIPSEVVLDLAAEELVTLGIITAISEKKRINRYAVDIGTLNETCKMIVQKGRTINEQLR